MNEHLVVRARKAINERLNLSRTLMMITFQMTFAELKEKAAEAKATKGRDLIHVHAVSLLSNVYLLKYFDFVPINKLIPSK